MDHGLNHDNKRGDFKTDLNHFGYNCGQCGTETYFKPRDQIRCGVCGSRVLFKKRTKRMVQFEAR